MCLASVFHYEFLERHDPEDDFSEEGNIEYLKNRRGYQGYSKVQQPSLSEIKEHLLLN